MSFRRCNQPTSLPIRQAGHIDLAPSMGLTDAQAKIQAAAEARPGLYIDIGLASIIMHEDVTHLSGSLIKLEGANKEAWPPKAKDDLTNEDMAELAVAGAGFAPGLGTASGLVGMGMAASKKDVWGFCLCGIAAIPILGGCVRLGKIAREGKLLPKVWKSVAGVARAAYMGVKVAKVARVARKIQPIAALGRMLTKAKGIGSKLVKGAAGRIAGKGKSTGGRELSVEEYLKKETQANEMYNNIRTATDDVSSIAKNTDMSVERVQRIKDHLFNNEHILSEGTGKFNPDYDIAQGWNRLKEGTYTKSDIDLLNHELFESKFEGIFKTDYRTAHNAADKSGRTWTPGE